MQQGFFPVRFLDLIVGRVIRNAQQLVVIFPFATFQLDFGVSERLLAFCKSDSLVAKSQLFQREARKRNYKRQSFKPRAPRVRSIW